MTISDSPKMTVRQGKKRGQKAAPLFHREVFAPLVILSLSFTSQWVLVVKSNSLNPNLSSLPHPSLVRLSPMEESTMGS